MYALSAHEFKDKKELYNFLEDQVVSLLTGERDMIANCANFTALLYHYLPDVNWLGFYFLKENQLVVGPFQGKPACVRIDLGKGVCGTAAVKKKPLIVPNVHEFPGHIACDVRSNAEIVLPLIKDGELVGILDIDSPVFSCFDREDQKGLERLLNYLISTTDFIR